MRPASVRREPDQPMGNATGKPETAVVDTTTWFRCTMLYLLVDYARPQDLIPGVGAIRPALLVMAVLIFFLIKHRALLVRGAKQIRMIWYFIALLGLFIPFARNNYYAYATFSEMLKFMPFILSLLICVNSIERLRTFVKFYVGVMVYVSLYAMTHGGMGSGNYFADENDVSLYINMVIPFCYFLFLIEEKKWTKVFYGTALMIGLLTVVISFSRGGFVGLVIMFFIVWLVSPRKMVTVVAILFLGTIVYFYAGETYLNEMGTVTDTKESTAKARLNSWASGLDMFLDNPLGVGGNNFQVRFPEYQGDRFNRGMWGRVAHSLWFTLIPETGIFGIVIYLRLLIYNLKDARAIRTRRKVLSGDDRYLNAMSIAFLASLAGFFASASFISVLYYPHYWYLTAMIVATVRIRKKLSEAPEDDALEKTPGKPFGKALRKAVGRTA
ncbi:O-antigen ligase family protein [Steroidobacter agaridevorans]|nr:O-antigen ligase family protein [Steroidobacter agaridevorans]